MDSHMQKNKVGPLLPFTKMNSKWITDLNGRAKTIKLLEENKGVNPWPWIRQWFLRYQKTQVTKEKIDKLDFIKNNFCATNDAIKKVNKQSSEWKKTFTYHLSDKTYIQNK